MTSSFITLVLLFLALGAAAQVAVSNITVLASRLGMNIFAFGIILGLVTTIPELSLGVNAQITDAGALAIGNLIGGMIIILSLVLGFSALLNRTIHTDGRLHTITPTLAVIALPLFLGADGLYSIFDGVCMVGAYIALVLYLHHEPDPTTEAVHKNKKFSQSNSRAALLSIFGVLGIMLSAHWIISIASTLLAETSVSPLLLGLTVFALGTNLPEISIALFSWHDKVSDLSLGHLLGSVFTNTLVIGLLATLKPVRIPIDASAITAAITLVIILVLLARFYMTSRALDYREGIVLILVYVCFVGTSAFIGV